jgi:hypothetical protein
MKRHALALIAVLAPLSAQAEPIKFETKSDVRFCRSQADMDQFLRYVLHGDDQAALAFFRSKEQEQTPGYGSSCWVDKGGGFYTLSDTAMGTVAPMECLRASGYTACAWTMARTITR